MSFPWGNYDGVADPIMSKEVKRIVPKKFCGCGFPPHVGRCQPNLEVSNHPRKQPIHGRNYDNQQV